MSNDNPILQIPKISKISMDEMPADQMLLFKRLFDSFYYEMLDVWPKKIAIEPARKQIGYTPNQLYRIFDTAIAAVQQLYRDKQDDTALVELTGRHGGLAFNLMMTAGLALGKHYTCNPRPPFPEQNDLAHQIDVGFGLLVEYMDDQDISDMVVSSYSGS